MDVTTTLVTADEFLTHPSAQGPSELVEGVIRVMTPASGEHGIVAGNVYYALAAHVRARRLGTCFPDNTGFALPHRANVVRAPDASFVRADRLPAGGVGPGWVHLAPDLVVEVLSPTESASDLAEKLADYSAAGTALVWVVDPEKRLVTVIAADAPPRWRREGDALDGGVVVPGFTLPVAELFEGVAAR